MYQPAPKKEDPLPLTGAQRGVGWSVLRYWGKLVCLFCDHTHTKKIVTQSVSAVHQKQNKPFVIQIVQFIYMVTILLARRFTGYSTVLSFCSASPLFLTTMNIVSDLNECQNMSHPEWGLSSSYVEVICCLYI